MDNKTPIHFSFINADHLDETVAALVEKYNKQQQEKQKFERDDFIFIDEASSLTNLAKQTIYGLVNKRKIPFYKNAKKLMFRISELKAWMAAGRQKTIQEIEEEAVSNFQNKKTSKHK